LLILTLEWPRYGLCRHISDGTYLSNMASQHTQSTTIFVETVVQSRSTMTCPPTSHLLSPPITVTNIMHCMAAARDCRPCGNQLTQSTRCSNKGL